MADNKPIDSIDKDQEIEALKAQLTAAETAKTAVEEQLKKAKKTGVIALPVKGEFTAKWETPLGEKKSRKVEFVNGAVKLRFPDGSGRLVITESVLKLANGKKLAKNEIEASPALGKWNTEDAAKYLTHLAQIEYGQLK